MRHSELLLPRSGDGGGYIVASAAITAYCTAVAAVSLYMARCYSKQQKIEGHVCDLL